MSSLHRTLCPSDPRPVMCCLYQSQNQQEEKKYGYICLSIHFRPLPLAAVPASFRASVGNGDDDVNATCYNFRTRAGLNPPDGPKVRAGASEVVNELP